MQWRSRPEVLIFTLFCVLRTVAVRWRCFHVASAQTCLATAPSKVAETEEELRPDKNTRELAFTRMFSDALKPLLSRFPLQDKPRLHKWVANMNRRGWTPSRHQYLCSEHFTQSCFDIRWGIRYLKQTAVPTIFPADNNDGEKDFCLSKQSPMITSSASEVGVEPKEASYYSSKPLILRNSWRAAQRNARQDAAEASKTGGLPLVVGTGIVFLTEIPEPGVCDDGMVAGSDLKQHPLDRLHTKAQLDSAVAELCCDASALTDTADPQTAPGQTFLEENSTARESSGGGRASADEHSYCRAEDTNRDQLWCKVLCLNAKIMELDRREQNTVAKIQALETEIALLQRDADRRL
ncbi:THAP domain-containing protein 5 isoform X1 [Oryzias latipes]